MVIKATTVAHGVIVETVENSGEAVKLLRRLAANGMKCIKWEIVKAARYVD